MAVVRANGELAIALTRMNPFRLVLQDPHYQLQAARFFSTEPHMAVSQNKGTPF